MLQGLVGAGASIKRDEKEQAVSTFKQALDWLLAEAKNTLNIQRYKGLGEMNPAATVGNHHGSNSAPFA